MASTIAEDLHLDVAAALDVLLDEHAAAGEVGLAQARHRLEAFVQLELVAADAQADATATGRALEHHRVADLPRRCFGVLDGREQVRARHERHACRRRDRTRLVLEPKAPELIRRRPDEGDAARRALLGELGVLAQEAVAGMDRLRAGLLGRIEDPLRLQVALRRRRAADQHRLIGEPHMQAARVRLRVHGNRAHAHSPQRADHSTRDLSTIGDQNLIEQEAPPSPVPTSTRTVSDCTHCTVVELRQFESADQSSRPQLTYFRGGIPSSKSLAFGRDARSET